MYALIYTLVYTVAGVASIACTTTGPASNKPAKEPIANLSQSDDGEEAATPPGKVYSSDDACQKLVALEASNQCGTLSKGASQSDCVGALDDLVKRTPKARHDLYPKFFECLSTGDTCAAVEACNKTHFAARYAGCDRPEELFSPVRPVPGAKTPSGRLAELNSTIGDPVEVCGVRGEQEFLMLSECADGSSPFRSTGQIRNARVGNVGAAGRCGSTIDLYQVKCPEKVYEVYMDMYVCAEGESLL